MNKEHLASLAQSILENEAFVNAIQNMRADALEKLVKADPADEKEIMALQSDVAAIDEFGVRLADEIRAGKPPKSNGIV